jgi:cation transport ATPase
VNLRNPAPNSDEAHASEHGLSSPAAVPPRERDKAGEIARPKKYPFSKESVIVLVVLVGIGLHLVLRYQLKLSRSSYEFPLLAVLILGGLPLVYELALKALHKEFGSDLLAGISIMTSAFLGEYLAGSLVVLMLSGDRVMESYAVRRASSVLEALAKRMPNIAHQQQATGIVNVTLEEVRIGNKLVVFPHEVCPVDGVVIEGNGIMDESYLTGEPFMMSKTSGSSVLSGAINGDSALTIRATHLPVDSRYANIMKVMRGAQQHRPRIRRLGDQLGAVYTPLALAAAIAAW